jgi:hypothetical protein
MAKIPENQRKPAKTKTPFFLSFIFQNLDFSLGCGRFKYFFLPAVHPRHSPSECARDRLIQPI